MAINYLYFDQVKDIELQAIEASIEALGGRIRRIAKTPILCEYNNVITYWLPHAEDVDTIETIAGILGFGLDFEGVAA